MAHVNLGGVVPSRNQILTERSTLVFVLTPSQALTGDAVLVRVERWQEGAKHCRWRRGKDERIFVKTVYILLYYSSTEFKSAFNVY